MMKFVPSIITLGICCSIASTASFGAPDPKATTAPAAPAVSTEPENTSASYGDWTVRCQRLSDTGPRACELQQSLQVQGQQGPIAQLALGRATSKDPFRLVVVLPSNISFPSSVRLGIDDKDSQPLDLSWRRCLPGRCLADVEFKDDDAKRWRAQTANGRMIFKDGTGKEQVLPFSFKGFAQALDGLAKATQ